MSQNVISFANPHELAHADTSEPILVALSGGADSSCLLHLLAEYSAKVGCALYAAHVNHNIRTDMYSQEAHRDEQFCRGLCEKLNVPLFVKSIDAPMLAKTTGESLETTARDARYAFFAEVMSQNGIKILATAHNADDNLETQIFNMCRGCSVDGLCGIPRQRSFPQVDGAVVVRPILGATKSEILDLCDADDIPYVTDSTNLEDDCTRNRIRHNIIPELVALFGTPQKAAARLSRRAKQDADFINAFAEQFLADNGGKLPIDKLCALHPSVSSRVLSKVFKQSYGTSLEGVHIDAVMNLIHCGNDGAMTSLPRCTRAAVRRGHLVLETDDRHAKSQHGSYEIVLIEGINEIFDTDFAVVIHADGAGSIDDLPHSEYELYASAQLYVSDINCLIARNRHEGDVILDGGMHKKVKKLMCDKKVDTLDRSSLPLICEHNEIIFVPLCAASDRVKKTTNKHKINIAIYKKHGGLAT